MDVQTGTEVFEDGAGQSFGEHIIKLGPRRNVENSSFTQSNPIADEVKVNLDMFGSLVLHGVGEEVCGADVLAVHYCYSSRWATKFLKELAQPCGLSDTVCDSSIFSLCAGAGHCWLPFRRPGDKVGAEKYTKTGRGLPCIRTAGPIGVEIGNEFSKG